MRQRRRAHCVHLSNTLKCSLKANNFLCIEIAYSQWNSRLRYIHQGRNMREQARAKDEINLVLVTVADRTAGDRYDLLSSRCR